tara:strand:+ start:269 stop:622 length:354 start_codon:yes stop_codon:yes gene_type:complete
VSKPERWTVGFRSAKYTDDPHEVYPVVSVPGGDWRPGTDHEYVRSGEQEQDARLMAAAPDLLEALKFMTAYAALNDDGCIGEESELVDVMLDPDDPGNVGRTIDMARAAIAKAGGAK